MSADRKGAIRVMAVDDHPVVRAGLVAIINSQPDMQMVAEAADGQQAIELYRLHEPDVSLMDLRLPKMGGVEAIRTIRRSYVDSRFIVLTTYDGDEDIYAALKAGAQSYLLKGMSNTELLDAIRAVYTGRIALPTPVLERLAERPYDSELTPRELSILQRLALGESNKEIGVELSIAESTVKWHVTLILSKLGVEDRTSAVTTALRRGILHV